MRLTLRSFTALLLLAPAALLPATADAQEPELRTPTGAEELVDRVVAVVGDSIITRTQIEEQFLRMQAAGMQTPAPTAPEYEAFSRDVLDDLISQLLIVQAAQRDTLVAVSDERVEATLRQAWDEQVQRFGTEAALRATVEQAGQSITQYRAQLRDEIRRDLLIQSYLQLRRQQGRAVPVEEAEIREFYERERDRLGERPATVTFEQAVFFPTPSEEVMAEARAEAERVREMLLDGENFADLARRFSGDEASRQQGGDLGWFRRGDGLVEEFEDAAFQLRPGMISQVVETGFGAHIIRVERVRGAERKIHHILISADLTEADTERARERAEEALLRVEAGESLTPYMTEQRGMGLPDSLSIRRDQLQQLPSAYAPALSAAQPGDVIGPLEFPTQNATAYAVVRVRDVRDAGEYSFEDVRGEIRALLSNEKFRERLIEDLRSRTYVEVRL